jgi:hypothetical protein
MQTVKKVRYWVFVVGCAAGSTAFVIWLVDYFVRFRPEWVAGTADRLFGLGPFYCYLGGSCAFFLVSCSVIGLWLALLMVLLPGKLSGCRSP